MTFTVGDIIKIGGCEYVIKKYSDSMETYYTLSRVGSEYITATGTHETMSSLIDSIERFVGSCVIREVKVGRKINVEIVKSIK